MGLDLTIREQRNFTTDEKGRTMWTTVQLANFRNCWTILEKFSNRLEDGLSNCSTVSFDEGTFHAILRELREELKESSEKEELKKEIEILEDFIREENLTPEEPSEEDEEEYGTDECYGRTFEVHAWW